MQPSGSDLPESLLRLKAERARHKTRLQRARQLSERGYELRGGILAIQSADDPEVLLCGPAGTGKSLGILHKINHLMWEYPGARYLICRKVRADLAQSTLLTFERDVLGFDNPICAGVQREYRHAYHYPNGSEIVVGGMDRPGKILSSDYDGIYPAEAVEFELEDWETFIMRLRTGVIPYQQVLADTNPGAPDHWLKQRCDAKVCKLINTSHKDNPRYWDGQDWTDRGRDYVLGKLGRLTGVRKKRYVENIWAAAEGAVYEEWNESIHLIDPFEIPPHWRRIRSIDFGYTNPFVCQWWAIDGDGRMVLYREIYMTKRRVAEHAEKIKQLSAGEKFEVTVSDHDAEDRATLHAAGVSTQNAVKAVSTGIQAVQKRLQIPEGQNKPRLFIFKECRVEIDPDLIDPDTGRHLAPTCTAEEISSYVWPKGVDGKPNKEVPVQVDDHGLDAMRYAVMYVDKGRTRVRQNSIYD